MALRDREFQVRRHRARVRRRRSSTIARTSFVEEPQLWPLVVTLHSDRTVFDAHEFDTAGEFAQTGAHAFDGLSARAFRAHRDAESKAGAGRRRRCPWPSLSMIARPDSRLSKTISIILSSPWPCTSIRSCTSSLHAVFLRAFGHLVELRDQLAELPNLLLKFAAVCHMPPLNANRV